MKILIRFFLLFVVIFFSIIASAQNYRPFPVGNIPFFKATDNEIRGVRVDSITARNKEHILHFYNEWDYTNYECIIADGPCWLGFHCIWDGSVMTFFNEQKDSLFIDSKKKLNEEWVFCRLSADSIVYAKIIEESKQNFLELSDSVKLIHLELRDSMGNHVDHTLNGFQLEISQSYGFVQLLNFLEFPDYLKQYSLCGLTNPKRGQTYINDRTIYDYEVGDVFHYEYNHSDAPWGSWVHTREIRKVIGKYLSADEDTVTYTIDRSGDRKIKDWTTSEESYSLYHDTVTDRHVFKPTNYLPYEAIIEDGSMQFYTQGIEPISNDRLVYSEAYWLYHSENDSCWSLIHFDGGAPNYYAEGCGLYYYNGDEGVGQYNGYLRYFKKGDEEWGIPLKVGVRDYNFTDTDIKIFPNPVKAGQQLNVTSNTDVIVDASIYTVEGKMMISYDVSKTNAPFELNVDKLNAGIYLLKMFGESGSVYYSKFQKE
ncbi:MAG: T9SS type A sorting domain-containing protein [Prolixibacteraceae bacterium]